MTVHELSQLYYLRNEIKQLTDQLDRLNRQPHTPAVEAQASETRASVQQRQDLYIVERNKLELWIRSIEDSLTRQIFTERFINCKSWQQVAQSIGGGNTVGGVKKITYRYLKRH